MPLAFTTWPAEAVAMVAGAERKNSLKAHIFYKTCSWAIKGFGISTPLPGPVRKPGNFLHRQQRF
jgi:hypothetical protein